MKKFGIVLFVFFSLGLTAGCNKVPAYDKNPTMENLTSMQRHLLVKLEHAGIQVIKEGMVFTFNIPTDCFFDKDTRALSRNRSKDLFALAQFLESYRHYFARPIVIISGFTDKVWLYPERKMLSVHYAQSVASYLSQGGVPSTIMKVNGYGAKMPIASNQYPRGTAYNRRVVVTIG